MVNEFSKQSLKAAIEVPTTAMAEDLINEIQEEVATANNQGYDFCSVKFVAKYSPKIKNKVAKHFEKLGMLSAAYGNTIELAW